MKITVSSFCEKGKVRSRNQDAIYYCFTDQWGIFALADGMGGHSEGERASRELVEGVRSFAASMPVLEFMQIPDILRMLKKILSGCNEKIRSKTEEGKLCGCTAIVMVLVPKACILVSIGDSRCYELKEDNGRILLGQMTVDDVVGGTGPQRNRLTNALGIKATLECRSKVIPLDSRNRFMICSDGVYKYCKGGEIEEALSVVQTGNLDLAAFRLKEAIARSGEKDNYSAILIQSDDMDTFPVEEDDTVFTGEGKN